MSEKKPAKGKGTPEVQDTAPVVYVGPNDLMKGLKTFTVYKQEPTELIDGLKAEYKNIARLFVPVAHLAKARENLLKKGTPINLAYQEMKQ